MYVFPELYNASLRMLITRLGTFVVIVLLVVFDKDFIDCFEQKVLVHFSHQYVNEICSLVFMLE